MIAIYAFSVPLMNSNTNSTNYLAIVKKSSTLKQLPSEVTDFPNNDASVLQVHTFKSVQDSLGQYQIRGEVVNLSNMVQASVESRLSLGINCESRSIPVITLSSYTLYCSGPTKKH
jgi:hypothetical protein